MVFYDALILIFSLFVLVKGSNIFVENSARLARHFGVSEFVVGLTLISFGTSLPELATSISASISKESGLIIGNIVGSNVANIGLILAIVTLFYTIDTKEKIFVKDSIYLLIVTILFIVLSADGEVSFVDASLLLIIFIFYTIHLFRAKKEEQEIGYQKFARIKIKKDLYKHIFLIILGMLGLYFGAKLLIPSAVNVATFLRVPTELIGVSIIAVGTSLPELFVRLTAAKKHLENILLGNILGSNLTNILLVIGVSGFINPIKVSNVALYYLMPFMLLMTYLLYRYVKNNWAARLLQGISLLLIYLVFILGLVFFKVY